MSSKFLKHPMTILMFATIACIFWGSAFPTLKISYGLLGIGDAGYLVKLQFAGYRFFLAGCFIYAVVLLRKKNLKVSKNAIVPLLLLGLCQTTLQYLFFYNGLTYTTGIKASILTSMGTLFSVILPHFYYHDDKMSLRKWIGLLVGFLGVVYINLSKGPMEAGFSFYGEGFLILAAFCGAVSSIMAKELSKKMDTLVMTSYQMIFGALVMIMISSLSLGDNVIPLTWSFAPYMIHLALISSLGFGLWFLMLEHNPISKVSIYKFQIPIWGTILSVLLLPDESLNLVVWISLMLVSAGILIINFPARKKV